LDIATIDSSAIDWHSSSRAILILGFAILYKPPIYFKTISHIISFLDKSTMTMTILKAIALIIIIIILASFIVGVVLSEKGYSGDPSDHFNGKIFINPSGRYSNDLMDVLKYVTTRKAEKWTNNYETFVRSEPLPESTFDELYVTFVNHSTFIIQYDNVTILTDPIWSKRCSPSQIGGPSRKRPPGVAYDDLKKVDIVIISHNHYDHLDKTTVKNLIRDFDPLFVVPLGVDHVLKKWGSDKVVPLDWWHKSEMHDMTITALPANHFSSRGTLDRDQTLWAGYLIEYKGHKTYFAGDTGYSDIFKSIGEKIGPIDLAFIPIGAYLPRWFMSPIHVSPDEAVMIHQDVRSHQSIAMHFGTFALADDGPSRPLDDLRQALKRESIQEKKFIAPEEGFSYRFLLSDSKN